jgi:hypothetical protein
VHALRNIHAVLVPEGLLVDTQPISAHPRVTVDAAELGRLDMREWIETIRAVEQRITEGIVAGLYELREERISIGLPMATRVASVHGCGDPG